MKPVAAILFLCSVSPAAAIPPWHHRDRAARVPVEVTAPPTAARNTPVTVGLKQASCHVYFDTLANGPQPFRAYREPVGIGDNFTDKSPDGVDPLCAGMRNDGVMATDWDGDGKIDLLSHHETSLKAVDWDRDGAVEVG
jgi:hypothetical protein